MLVAMPGAGERPEGWLATLRTLKAQRDVSCVVVTAPANDGRALPELRKDAHARLQAVLSYLRDIRGVRDAPTVLLGSRDGGEAALRLAGEDASVRAAAALSPSLDAHDATERDAVQALSRRLVFVAMGVSQAQSQEARDLQTSLANLRFLPQPGPGDGLDLLESPTLRADLAGWLYAALGPER